jgi:hypothetical protein
MGQMALSLALAAATPAGANTITFRDVVNVKGSTIALGDVADLEPIPAAVRVKASTLVLLTFDRKQKMQTIPHLALAARARALMPGLGPWLTGPTEGRLSVNPPKPALVRIIAEPADGTAITPGDKIIAHIVAGKVMISRPAVALQAARSGQRIFVRTSDGILTAICCGDR